MFGICQKTPFPNSFKRTFDHNRDDIDKTRHKPWWWKGFLEKKIHFCFETKAQIIESFNTNLLRFGKYAGKQNSAVEFNMSVWVVAIWSLRNWLTRLWYRNYKKMHLCKRFYCVMWCLVLLLYCRFVWLFRMCWE